MTSGARVAEAAGRGSAAALGADRGASGALCGAWPQGRGPGGPDLLDAVHLDLSGKTYEKLTKNL